MFSVDSFSKLVMQRHKNGLVNLLKVQTQKQYLNVHLLHMLIIATNLKQFLCGRLQKVNKVKCFSREFLNYFPYSVKKYLCTKYQKTKNTGLMVEQLLQKNANLKSICGATSVSDSFSSLMRNNQRVCC